MRHGTLRLGGGLVFMLGPLGACQSIIGISSYEIDPSLERSAGQGGIASFDSGGDEGTGAAEDGTAGMSAGEAGGAAGADGGVPAGCSEDVDCDDTIDCTTDRCDESGACVHEGDHEQCESGPGECLKCELGIGCVAGPVTVLELLLDPAFDEHAGDWTEYSEYYDGNLFEDPGAESPTYLAKFGPAPPEATAEEYADLGQLVTIPEQTTHLVLAGYYTLSPGTVEPAADYVAAALYERNALEPIIQFHSWAGNGDKQSTWKSFDYEADPDEVREVWGEQLSFDLVAHTTGSIYRFDTLSLQATICQ